ncbi:MAG: hypothetical protein ABI672_07860 [Vicinamibacteria bacterium]
MRLPIAVLSLTFVALLVATPPAHATLKIQKEAKAAGFAATNCLYCHNEKLPVKGKTTHNERGTFLITHKEAVKAKEVDVAWLKDYVETKK